MKNKNTKESWEEYKKIELEKIDQILKKLGYTLEDKQPHISGERFLSEAVTTAHGRKFILVGHNEAGEKVIIKVTNDKKGVREIEHERKCREILKEIKFAYQIFFTPTEILFTKKDGCTISIQEFIEQEKSFLERGTPEQFGLALKAFKAQESAHATTYAHERLVRKNFGSIDAKGYLKVFDKFKKDITSYFPENKELAENLKKAEKILEENKEVIEQYCGFLTHVDFVPHNIRVANGNIYLLDHSSLRFGNKYEGWARFLNFMTLYNPTLEAALIEYVKNNRTEEESLSLQLMRIYRLGEIIWYYTNTLDKTSGDLHTLNTKRIQFWTEVLEAVLENKNISKDVVEKYKNDRNSLRSGEEKERQIGLH